MKQVVIENPIINSPFEEPKRHFRFTEEGITNEIVEERRKSSYFIPIPQPKKRGKQLSFETEWTEDRVEENKFINRVRERVGQWRQGGYVGITKTSARLLEHWQSTERERKLFFCQIRSSSTADIAPLEADIDRLVYQLYGLSAEELAVVEGKG